MRSPQAEPPRLIDDASRRPMPIPASPRSYGSPMQIGRSRTHSQRGFSLLEVMFASLILLIVALGLLPLFSRSITDNNEGRQATEVSNLAKSELERLLQLNFNAPELTILPGSTETRTEAYLKDLEDDWIDAGAWNPTESWIYHRIVTVRQYALDALTGDEILNPTEAIDGGAPVDIHFKEIVIDIESSGFIGGAAKQLTVRTLKAS